MDIRMPEMNGLDATRIIKEVNHDVPVIALSAYAFEENIREAKLAGCDEFMAKPFRVEDLIETVKKYIGE
jgi:CheY-like chemotaxis protein